MVAENCQLHRQMYEMLKGRDSPSARMVAEWLEGIFSAMDDGRPIVYHSFALFSEVIIALGLQPLCCEAWDMMGANVDPQHPLKSIDAAHEAGIPAEMCSYDKAILGSVLRETIPPPTMIALSATPCQNVYITYQAVAHLTGAPLWVSDIPYNLDEEGAMEYWIEQYKGLISFLEEHSGKKMDYDRLREVVEESNRCVEYWLELMELQKMKPAPRSGPLWTGTYAGMTSFGVPSSTAAVKSLLDKVKEDVAQGKTAVADEKVRVIWFHFPVGWDTGLMKWMGELGAVVPYVEMDGYRAEPVDTSTLESMLRGMAKRALEVPMVKVAQGATDHYIEDLLYVVEEWKGDCAIIAGHPGCKWITGAHGLIRDACRERGIPVLLYDLDLVDHRVTSGDESRTRIEQFLNMVMER